MARRPLARLEQEIGIRLLCAQQRFAGRAGIQRDVGSAERLVGGSCVVEIVRELADAAAQVLLLRDDVLGGGGRGGDAAPRQQLQHLARPQPLARLESGADTAAVPLDECELRVHVPLVGEKRGAPLRQDERATGTIELVQRTPQLTRGRVGRAPPLAAQHARPARM